ncbi:asparagine--tRNA ligase [Candidatus Dependentiae bacterium]|nr:asparagine--tRNA ligase [Candidatus Dependentiae bacterium]
MRVKINKISQADIGKAITIKGWIRTVRDQGQFAFITINDGSCLAGLQVVADNDTAGYEEVLPNLSTGAAVSVDGLVVESPGKGQAFELKAQSIELIGACDSETYPLQKKRHTFEFLRTIAHLRPRTNTIGAVTRVRNALAFATHKFFNEEGFYYINTPIVTGSDCEGAGQMFQVTTFDFDNVPKKDREIDYSQDFFDKRAYLTVSGQLEGEAFACAMSDIYTFGPTFRAENSNTSRHLAEFWMIEPELAFADINDDMDCAEKYVKYIISYVLENCQDDLEFFNKFIDEGLLGRLKHLVESPFERVTYTQAVEILQKSGKTFEFPVVWGKDLQSEHERYLAEEHFKTPVFVVDYPKEIKSFYMRLNDDGKTVAAMDMLVAGVGELIGGSQREERLDILKQRIEGQGLCLDDYWWYLELRKYGSVPHAGFGLGFERLVQLATGMENIRDVIPFPRYPGHVEF